MASSPSSHAQDGSADSDPLAALSPTDHQALRWSVRISDGLTPAEQTEFHAWLLADPANGAALTQFDAVWEGVADFQPQDRARLRTTVAIDVASQTSARDVAKLATSVGDNTFRPAEDSQRRTSEHRGRRPALAGIAMVALAVLAGFGAWEGWTTWQAMPVFQQHFATARGQSLSTTLPEGSELVLDTTSQADVSLYRTRREVKLAQGQVLFEVAKDASKPFDVLAGSTRITVLGTRFVVRRTAEAGTDGVRVAVLEGKVRVTQDDGAGARSIDLTPGQTLWSDANGKLDVTTGVPVAAMDAWRQRRLEFDNVPLAQVLAEIERYGDSGITLADSAVRDMPVTASVDLRDISRFVRALPQVLPVRLAPAAGGFEVRSARGG